MASRSFQTSPGYDIALTSIYRRGHKIYYSGASFPRYNATPPRASLVKDRALPGTHIEIKRPSTWHGKCRPTCSVTSSINTHPTASLRCQPTFEIFKRDTGKRWLASTPNPPDYSPPGTGFLSYLPDRWVPYAELARLDKPAGMLYLFFPCVFSTIMSSSYTMTSPASMFSTAALFGIGALVMRGAGCTINDLWDRDFDPQVARTRLRPLARRAISPRAALGFAGAQCLAGLAILLQFPQPSCLIWGAPSLILVGLYPLAKRVTHYPQFVLGLTFSWGSLMGFPALGVDLATDRAAASAVACLYASCVSWTVLYDMIYAHMDLKDDRIAGIKSIALRHEENTKVILTGLAAIQVGLLASAGAFIDLGATFYVGSCGGSLVSLLLMIRRVNLRDASSCWWWFRYGAWLTGGSISLGMLGDYLWMQRRDTELLASRDLP